MCLLTKEKSKEEREPIVQFMHAREDVVQEAELVLLEVGLSTISEQEYVEMGNVHMVVVEGGWHGDEASIAPTSNQERVGVRGSLAGKQDARCGNG